MTSRLQFVILADSLSWPALQLEALQASGATNIYLVLLLSEDRYEEELVVIDGYRETFSLLACIDGCSCGCPGAASATSFAAPA